MTGPPHSSDPDAPPGRLTEVALLFLRLGFTAFGGPAAHVAMMEDEVVRKRQWLDRQHFLDLVAALNFIPGPNSTELAIHLGLIRAGYRGLIVAGVCFITPAVLIILPLAWAYVRYGNRPDLPAIQGAMLGIGAVVLAIIVVAAWRFATTSLRDPFLIILAISVLGAEWAMNRWMPKSVGLQAELALLAVAAIAGLLWYARPRWNSTQSLPLLAIPLTTLPATAPSSAWSELMTMAGFFLKVGATLFGSGYVLVAYLQSGLVDGPHPILSQQELVDAIAVGQVTPGPLLTTATFVGYVHGQRLFGGSVPAGVLGALLATLAIFLPSFILVAIFGRLLPRIRQSRYARAALDGMNAAVTALIISVAIRLLMDFRTPAGNPDWFRIAIASLSLPLLLWGRINSTWILAAALLGSLIQPNQP